jgi:predicted nucleic acid-binding protein
LTSRVYWDTMLFIYWIEEHPTYVDRIKRILSRMEMRGDQLCSSAFGLGEVLVGPMQRDDRRLAGAIRAAMRPPHVELLPFDAAAAERYAAIRARNRTKLADSIHLACAASAGVDLYLTNDVELTRLDVPGIRFIAGLDAPVL